jgi:hypothetical protein
VGTTCPKHDLVLEAEVPPSPHLDAAGQPVRWVMVARYADSLAAEAPRIRLEAEGIPTFVEGERMGSRSMYHVATGGVKLKVPEALAAEARIILSQTWSATAAELDVEDEFVDDLEESWPEPPPAPESPLPNQLRSAIKEVCLVLLVGLPILWAIHELVSRWTAR